MASALMLSNGVAQTTEDFDALVPGHNNASRAQIDYSPWTEVLELTVWNTGRSDREYARRDAARLGSRINSGNPNPSSLEANRTFYHILNQPQLDFIATYRSELMVIPERVDMARLSRNEQLAFWLNLYTVTVYEQIASRYPIRNVLQLREDGLWEEKLLNINGIPLSLRDIETGVLTRWRNPLVIYGLYQGAIGGPNIRDKAFNGKYVWTQLEDNAREFINSLRGLRFMGDVAHASVFYDWQSAFFEDVNLKDHLMHYADSDVAARLRESERLELNVYDEFIADLYNGEFSAGASSDNPAEFVMNQAQSFGGGSGDPGEANYSATPGGYGSVSGRAAESRSSGTAGLPEHVQLLVDKIRIRMAQTQQGRVSISDVTDSSQPEPPAPDPDRGDETGAN